jgi:acetyl esterase/lipase
MKTFILPLALLIIAVTCAAADPATTPPTTAPAQPPPPKKPFADKIPPDVKVIPDLEYVPGGGKWQSLDLYLPKGGAGKIPLVVFVHGGGWNSGTDKDWHPSFHDLLANGFAVATINYRLVPSALWPAQIFDTKAAVRWLRAHAADYNLDPDRFGVWGHSAGGHLAAMMGTTNGNASLEGDEGVKGVSSDVQAACDWSGPSDLVTAYDQMPPNSPLYKVDLALVGGPSPNVKDALKNASPITYVNSKSVPFLIEQGANDNIVPLTQSTELNNALQKAGVESTQVVVPGADHGVVPHLSQGPSAPDVYAPVTAFFEKHLKSSP